MDELKKNGKSFTTNGLELIVISRKSAVILEIDRNKHIEQYNFIFNFTEERFKEFLRYIESIAHKTWKNFTPKKASSPNSDYAEYYDSKLDSNGYLNIKGNSLLIERPSLESERLYQFNKGKMESFIYDFRERHRF